MSRTTPERALQSALDPIGKRFGFTLKKGPTLQRDWPDGQQQLKFGGNKRRDKFLFNMTVCLRFNAVQRLFGAEEDLETPTLMVPSHLLHADRSFSQWSILVSDPIDVELATSIADEIERYALPFFSRFADLREVQRNLESPEGDWFVLSKVQRTCLLSALLWIQGDQSGAQRLLDDGLAASPSRFEAEELTNLRRRMSAAASTGEDSGRA